MLVFPSPKFQAYVVLAWLSTVEVFVNVIISFRHVGVLIVKLATGLVLTVTTKGKVSSEQPPNDIRAL